VGEEQAKRVGGRSSRKAKIADDTFVHLQRHIANPFLARDKKKTRKDAAYSC
jgi:hypothetical protein